MNRRDALLSMAGTLAVGIAGCNDLTPGGNETSDGTAGNGTDGMAGNGTDGTAGNDTDGSEREIDYTTPESVARAHMLARGDGDLQGILATVHTESPVRSALEETNETALQEQTANLSLTVDNTTVLEQNETEAVVEVTTTATLSGQENTATATFELRTEDDQWKIWQSTPGGPAIEPADVEVGDDPEAVYRRYFEAQSNDEFAVLLGVCHTEGPTFADFSQFSEAQFRQQIGPQSFTVEETTVIEESEDSVVVRGTVVWEPEFAEEPNTIEPDLELRKENGQWRIWGAPDE